MKRMTKAALIFGVGIALAGCTSNDGFTRTASLTSGATSSAGYTATTTADTAALPNPSDFKVKVTVIKQDCYGTAGCNVTFVIEPSYVGFKTLPKRTFRVLFTITGGGSPKSDSFTVTDNGTHMRFTKEGTISTDGSDEPVITAAVTQVIED
ncbi:MAG: hypothetical protein WBZ37_05990 [Mycobacterium sp.]